LLRASLKQRRAIAKLIICGARTVSVRSAFDDESDWRIITAPSLPPAANRDGSRSVYFKLTHYLFLFAIYDLRVRLKFSSGASIVNRLS
jgi:hypothetical protein